MNKVKLQGLGKFVAFLLIAVIVISIIVFTVNGNDIRDIEQNKSNESISDQPNGDVMPEEDANVPNDTENDEENTTVMAPDKTINIMTGLPYTAGASTTAFGIVIDPQKPIYGLSYADIAIEFPTEGNDSRMLFYLSEEEIVWKIGSLAKTRDYIDSVSSLFGGINLSFGNDDKIIYSSDANGVKSVDLSKHNDCYYVENEQFIFTNSNFLSAALERTEFSDGENGYTAAPFKFSDSGFSGGIGVASSVCIPYNKSNSTTLVYNSKTAKYQYIKNDEIKYDLLTGDMISYTNAFILFANSTTYENSDASQLVMNTTGGGTGYYLTKGTYTEINWHVIDGRLEFCDLAGNVLEANCGNSYITYYKASKIGDIMIN